MTNLDAMTPTEVFMYAKQNWERLSKEDQQFVLEVQQAIGSK